MKPPRSALMSIMIIMMMLWTTSLVQAQGMSIRTSNKAECTRLCNELVFDCNSGTFTSTGWCIIVTDKAPVVQSGLAIKTPTQRECDDVAYSTGESGRWNRNTNWCVIGTVTSYRHVANAAIYMKNNIPPTLRNKSVSECKAACTANNKCKSFDYNKTKRHCLLSTYSTATETLKRNYKNHPWDYYEKQKQE